jgi:hypothetical protein
MFVKEYFLLGYQVFLLDLRITFKLGDTIIHYEKSSYYKNEFQSIVQF